jgi:hypothetical protein
VLVISELGVEVEGWIRIRTLIPDSCEWPEQAAYSGPSDIMTLVSFRHSNDGPAGLLTFIADTSELRETVPELLRNKTRKCNVRNEK